MGALAAELLRYNAWANRRLIDFCAELDQAQLAARLPTAYGSIHETLTHVIRAEAAFSRWITGDWVEPPIPDGVLPPLAELAARADRLGTALAEAARRTRPNKVLAGTRRGAPVRLPAAALFATAMYHAGEHRAQVVAILCEAGVKPPDLSGWRFGGDRSGDYDE
jgi:uncharacterized damage-inducible protein DinB